MPYQAKDEEYFFHWPETQRLTVIGPSDALLMGVGSVGPVTGGGDWICANSHHWLFAGTGMKKGEGIPGLVGWEYHGGPSPCHLFLSCFEGDFGIFWRGTIQQWRFLAFQVFPKESFDIGFCDGQGACWFNRS